MSLSVDTTRPTSESLFALVLVLVPALALAPVPELSLAFPFRALRAFRDARFRWILFLFLNF